MQVWRCWPTIEFGAGERMDVSLQSNQALFIDGLRDARGRGCCLRRNMPRRSRQNKCEKQNAKDQAGFEESHRLAHTSEDLSNGLPHRFRNMTRIETATD